LRIDAENADAGADADADDGAKDESAYDNDEDGEGSAVDEEDAADTEPGGSCSVSVGRRWLALGTEAARARRAVKEAVGTNTSSPLSLSLSPLTLPLPLPLPLPLSLAARFSVSAAVKARVTAVINDAGASDGSSGNASFAANAWFSSAAVAEAAGGSCDGGNSELRLRPREATPFDDDDDDEVDEVNSGFKGSDADDPDADDDDEDDDEHNTARDEHSATMAV
jgi:hypothetical protein